MQLQHLGATVAHKVDATKLSSTLPKERRRAFDAVVFNFPHTGTQQVTGGGVKDDASPDVEMRHTLKDGGGGGGDDGGDDGDGRGDGDYGDGDCDVDVDYGDGDDDVDYGDGDGDVDSGDGDGDGGTGD